MKVIFWICFVKTSANICFRRSSDSVEIQIEALPYPLLRWEANIQPAWRSESHQWLHRDHTNNYLILPRSERSSHGIHSRENKICCLDRRATLFRCYKQTRGERCAAQGSTRSVIYADPLYLNPPNTYPTLYQPA